MVCWVIIMVGLFCHDHLKSETRNDPCAGPKKVEIVFNKITKNNKIASLRRKTKYTIKT